MFSFSIRFRLSYVLLRFMREFEFAVKERRTENNKKPVVIIQKPIKRITLHRKRVRIFQDYQNVVVSIKNVSDCFAYFDGFGAICSNDTKVQ